MNERTHGLLDRLSARSRPDDAALAALEAEWAPLGEDAVAAMDARITPDQLARQFDVIERRLDGQPARVLQFPHRRRDLRTPRPLRRWVAMAAACGLMFGLAAGRLIGPASVPEPARMPWASSAARPHQAGTPRLEPAIADERLLGEVDAALSRTLHEEFRALDELTPVATVARARR